MPIEDYAMIGDTETAALVGRDGSIDWLCLPRFDSGSCFAKLLGEKKHGRWQVIADQPVTSHVRRYRSRSMVLETEITTGTGVVQVIDFMPPRHHHPRVVRIVRGVEGEVQMRTELILRFEYGHDVPWVRRTARGLLAIAGPNAVILDSPIELKGIKMRHEGRFKVHAGEEVAFVLAWYPSHEDPPYALDTARAFDETEKFWSDWCGEVLPVHGEWDDLALRSLITLKGLTYGPTGGIVAAATTSLPESLGGVRNWDYRYCWVRDATFTLEALIESGLREEAESWLAWLGRVAAGDPDQLQIMYGPAGERRLTELEIDWLPGYEGSSPVRIGNAASGQFQLDVYGELMDAIDRARSHGIVVQEVIWRIQVAIMGFLIEHWSDPDDGIWEVRGPPRLFTHSKVMAWVAFDRAVRGVEVHGLEGPAHKWSAIRDAIHAEVCEKGWNADVGAFTQFYGAVELDASLLMMPLVGFLPADDERVVRTVDAIQEHLTEDGFVLRYQVESGVDGLPGREGMFLPCTLWLIGCLRLMGRLDQATAVFRRVAALVNDVGLISEEYDPGRRRLLGNFPQAFTHVGIVNAARGLTASHAASHL
ncbi:MAG: glycoside hydrolase family 15 protein [Acidimicrobiales bacterium]